jgi:hypothetical protein
MGKNVSMPALRCAQNTLSVSLEAAREHEMAYHVEKVLTAQMTKELEGGDNEEKELI